MDKLQYLNRWKDEVKRNIKMRCTRNKTPEGNEQEEEN